jgi:hypothetical protein
MDNNENIFSKLEEELLKEMEHFLKFMKKDYKRDCFMIPFLFGTGAIITIIDIVSAHENFIKGNRIANGFTIISLVLMMWSLSFNIPSLRKIHKDQKRRMDDFEKDIIFLRNKIIIERMEKSFKKEW